MFNINIKEAVVREIKMMNRRILFLNVFINSVFILYYVILAIAHHDILFLLISYFLLLLLAVFSIAIEVIFYKKEKQNIEVKENLKLTKRVTGYIVKSIIALFNIIYFAIVGNGTGTIIFSIFLIMFIIGQVIGDLILFHIKRGLIFKLKEFKEETKETIDTTINKEDIDDVEAIDK